LKTLIYLALSFEMATQQTTTSTRFKCAHCGDAATGALTDRQGNAFCCQGCASVHGLLYQFNLGNFYELSDLKAVKPREIEQSRYDHLDDQSVESLFLSYQDEQIYKVSLKLPQIHCAACIYLLENLYRFDAGVVRSEVDFLKKEAHFTVKKQKLSFKALVILLAQLGYEPQLHHGLDQNKTVADEEKALIRRLAVAGFIFGNIMLLSFPEYLSPGGVQEPLLRSVIQTLIILLSLPLLFYSGRSYFEQAWLGLRKRDLNINIPIALGMLALFGRSVFEIVSGIGHGYLDSLAALIFFLLIGRYFQQKTYDHLSFERDYRSFFPLGVTRSRPNQANEEVPISKLQAGDHILVRNDEIIPTDSILNSTSTLIDYSFVTGESALQEKFRGDVLYAGGKIAGPLVELEVIKAVAQGYLTRLWNQEYFSKGQDDPFKTITNRISQYFTPAVLLLAVGGLLFWLPTSAGTAFQVFAAVLIIACPCALALSAPFTYGHAMRILGRNGLFVKNSAVVDKLSQLKQIVFDKTGTLTRRDQAGLDLSALNWEENDQMLVKTACQHSTHPLSRQLADVLSCSVYDHTDLYDEQQGKGILALIQGHEVVIGSATFVGLNEIGHNQGTRVYIRIDNNILGFVRFKNHYRKGMENSIATLSDTYTLAVLSGDNDQERHYLQQVFGQQTNIRFNQSPAGKLESIQNMKQHDLGLLMMVGDGLNDAAALRQADIGMAVSEKSGQFTPASDVIIDAEQLSKLHQLLRFVRQTRIIIFSNLSLSLIYNITGLSFALSGLLTPVVSAILMPVSSITVVLNATLMNRYFATKNKLR